MFAILTQKILSEFLEEVSGLILPQEHKSFLIFGEIAENSQHFEQIVAALTIIVDPREKDPWKFFETMQGVGLNDAEGDFGVEGGYRP
jgi:hypothetical protein